MKGKSSLVFLHQSFPESNFFLSWFPHSSPSSFSLLSVPILFYSSFCPLVTQPPPLILRVPSPISPPSPSLSQFPSLLAQFPIPLLSPSSHPLLSQFPSPSLSVPIPFSPNSHLFFYLKVLYLFCSPGYQKALWGRTNKSEGSHQLHIPDEQIKVSGQMQARLVTRITLWCYQQDKDFVCSTSGQEWKRRRGLAKCTVLYITWGYY